jgi:hypothetical protein
VLTTNVAAAVPVAHAVEAYRADAAGGRTVVTFS